MNTFTIVVLATVVLNAIIYTFEYCIWLRDCKELGKDHLGVSLGERIRLTFLCVTLPCLVGLATRK